MPFQVFPSLFHISAQVLRSEQLGERIPPFTVQTNIIRHQRAFCYQQHEEELKMGVLLFNPSYHVQKSVVSRKNVIHTTVC